MAQVSVELVGAEELPMGHSWCLIEVPTKGIVGFFREDHFSPQVVAEAWQALVGRL